MRTLLLDSTFFPVKIIGWQRAMILFLGDRAEVIDEYSEIDIRSVSKSYKLPKVLRLFSRHRGQRRVRFTRTNVFWRDHWSCQYCSKKLPTSELTFDHVMPIARGGEHSWQNVVTACRGCNIKKGCKTPKEANMKLLRTPRRPAWSAQLCLKVKKDDPREWGQWFPLKNSKS